MKKIIAALLTVAVLLCTFVVPSFAATKADLLNEAAKAPIYKYVKAAVENAARNIEITEEQADQLMPLVKEAVALLSADNGPSMYDVKGHKNYTDAQLNAVMNIIKKACDILGFTYTFSSAASTKGSEYHVGDIIFKVFDKNGKLVFSYDGDLVADTSAVAETDSAAWVALTAASVVTLAAAAAFVFARKKVSE